MQWNEVDDEHIATPGGHHVEIGESSRSGPHHRANLHRLYPQIVCKEEGKYGNALVVIGTSDRAGDVAGDDGNETSSQKTSTIVPDLASQQETGYSRQTTATE